MDGGEQTADTKRKLLKRKRDTHSSSASKKSKPVESTDGVASTKPPSDTPMPDNVSTVKSSNGADAVSSKPAPTANPLPPPPPPIPEGIKSKGPTAEELSALAKLGKVPRDVPGAWISTGPNQTVPVAPPTTLPPKNGHGHDASSTSSALREPVKIPMEYRQLPAEFMGKSDAPPVIDRSSMTPAQLYELKHAKGTRIISFSKKELDAIEQYEYARTVKALSGATATAGVPTDKTNDLAKETTEVNLLRPPTTVRWQKEGEVDPKSVQPGIVSSSIRPGSDDSRIRSETLPAKLAIQSSPVQFRQPQQQAPQQQTPQIRPTTIERPSPPPRMAYQPPVPSIPSTEFQNYNVYIAFNIQMNVKALFNEAHTPAAMKSRRGMALAYAASEKDARRLIDKLLEQEQSGIPFMHSKYEMMAVPREPFMIYFYDTNVKEVLGPLVAQMQRSRMSPLIIKEGLPSRPVYTAGTSLLAVSSVSARVYLNTQLKLFYSVRICPTSNGARNVLLGMAADETAARAAFLKNKPDEFNPSMHVFYLQSNDLSRPFAVVLPDTVMTPERQ